MTTNILKFSIVISSLILWCTAVCAAGPYFVAGSSGPTFSAGTPEAVSDYVLAAIFSENPILDYVTLRCGVPPPGEPDLGNPLHELRGQCVYVKRHPNPGEEGMAAGFVDVALCSANYTFLPTTTGTVNCKPFSTRSSDRPSPPKGVCSPSNPSFGDPIFPLTASNQHEVDLGVRIGGKSLQMVYNSIYHVPGVNGAKTLVALDPYSFGYNWKSSMHKSLMLGAGGVQLNLGGSAWISANSSVDSCFPSAFATATNYVSPGNPHLQIGYAPSAQTFFVNDRKALTEAKFRKQADGTSADYKIVNEYFAGGGWLNYNYTGLLLTSIDDNYGRSIKLAYDDGSSGLYRIASITNADGAITTIEYDNYGNVQAIVWPDQSVRTFVYENSNLPWALTGVLDEGGSAGSPDRYATFGYDAEGRATETQLGRGADHFLVSYATPPSWNVSETVTATNVVCRDISWRPAAGVSLRKGNSTDISLGSRTSNGMVALSSKGQPAGSGCSAALVR